MLQAKQAQFKPKPPRNTFCHRRGRNILSKRKRVVFVSDAVASLRSILVMEEDFNVALNEIEGFLSRQPGSFDRSLSICDILLLKKAHVLFHSTPLVVEVKVSPMLTVSPASKSLLDYGAGKNA